MEVDCGAILGLYRTKIKRNGARQAVGKNRHVAVSTVLQIRAANQVFNVKIPCLASPFYGGHGFFLNVTHPVGGQGENSP